MAYEIPGKTISLTAGADLSAKQYYFVSVDSAEKAQLTVDNGNAIGVLQNKPTLGQSADIMIDGVSKFVGGGALPAGTVIGSNAFGKAKTAVAATYTAGTVIKDPGADGQIGTMVIQHGGKEA